MSKAMREVVNEIVAAINAEKSAAKRDTLKGKLLKVVGAAAYEAVLGPLTAAQKASLGANVSAPEQRGPAAGSAGEGSSSDEEEEEEASSSDGDVVSDDGSDGGAAGNSEESGSEDELAELEARHAARQVRASTVCLLLYGAPALSVSHCTVRRCMHPHCAVVLPEVGKLGGVCHRRDMRH